MLKDRGEKKFKKQFPALKQVINGNEIEFEMSGQVPLQNGLNSIYLLEPNGRKTTYTEFEVDNMHKYGLRVELNINYIMDKLKKKIIMSIIIGIAASLMLQIALRQLGLVSLLISVITLITIYSLTVNKLIKGLGISAYKVVVVTQPSA